MIRTREYCQKIDEFKSPQLLPLKPGNSPNLKPITPQEKQKIAENLTKNNQKIQISFNQLKILHNNKLNQQNSSKKNPKKTGISHLDEKVKGSMTEPRKAGFLLAPETEKQIDFSQFMLSDAKNKDNQMNIEPIQQEKTLQDGFLGSFSDKGNKFSSNFPQTASKFYPQENQNLLSRFGQINVKNTINLNEETEKKQEIDFPEQDDLLLSPPRPKKNSLFATDFGQTPDKFGKQQANVNMFSSPQKIDIEEDDQQQYMQTPPKTQQKQERNSDFYNQNQITPEKGPQQKLFQMSTPSKEYRPSSESGNSAIDVCTPQKSAQKAPFFDGYNLNSIEMVQSQKKAKKMINNYGKSMQNNNIDVMIDDSPIQTGSSGNQYKFKSIYKQNSFQSNSSQSQQDNTPKQTQNTNSSNNNMNSSKSKNYSDDYIFQKQIGQGSFGSVWKCQNIINNKMYAIKRTKQFIRGSGSKKEVLNEVQAMAKFTQMEGSQNIVQYTNAWIENNQLYLAMEYCKGSLSQKRQEIEVFPESEIRKILKEVSQGLKLIHKQNTAHLDIKPENILISFSNLYKIADLGLSRFKNLKRGEYLQEGDSRYLAKELLNQPKPGEILDMSKADIFSLGISLYELMTQKTLQCNGDEWHNIRKGILDWDFEQQQQSPANKIEIEEDPEENIIQNVEEISSFQQSMMAMMKSEEKEQMKQQQQQKPNTQKKVKYSEELKNLVRQMMHPDIKKRPSAEEILKNNYLQGEKHILRCEQHLNNLLKQELEGLKEKLSQQQQIRRKYSFNS